MRASRIVTDKVVKNAHVAIDCLQELLLIFLHLSLDVGLSSLEFFLDKRLYLLFQI